MDCIRVPKKNQLIYEERTRAELTDIKRFARIGFGVFDKLGTDGSAIEQGKRNKIADKNAWENIMDPLTLPFQSITRQQRPRNRNKT